MSEKSADMWNQAAVAGLSLGGVSIAYMLLTYLLGLLPEGAALNVLTSVLNLLLWVAKFVGCILLLRFFIRKYASSDIEASHSKSFKFGALVAFLSALVYVASPLLPYAILYRTHTANPYLPDSSCRQERQSIL